MMLGLAGAHRTGKTTLAKRFAEVSGYTFVETKTSQVFKRLGLDPRVDYPLEQRLMIQDAILDCLEESYAKNRHYSIVDRTPIDLMSYMIADVTRQNADPYIDPEIMIYLQRCYDLSRQYFAGLVVVQPGIQVIEDLDKAPGVESYMEHINMLCLGALSVGKLGSVRCYVMNRSCIDLEERVESLINIAVDLPVPYYVVSLDQKLPM